MFLNWLVHNAYLAAINYRDTYRLLELHNRTEQKTYQDKNVPPCQH